MYNNSYFGNCVAFPKKTLQNILFALTFFTCDCFNVKVIR